MIGRRRFMALTGGGIILAAAAAGGGWAATRDPVAARRPWAEAGGDPDPRRLALSYAILAPNPHNRQPWIADLSVPDEITLAVDLDRRLPATDPFDRQITVGLGCFLELLSMASAAAGFRADVALFPDGEPQPRLDARPVARIRLIPEAGADGDPLFAWVLDRRSNKDPFDVTRPVAEDALHRIGAQARTSRIAHTADPAEVARIRDIAWSAMRLEMSTPVTARESIDLIRIGRAEIEASPDGIDLSGPLMEGLDALGMLPREAMLDTGSTVFRQQMEAMKPPFDTAMAFLWLATEGNTRADQIRAGRDYVRLNLAATSAGVAMHPMSQSLQEFPEMEGHFHAMREELAVDPGQTLQMLVRLGYGEPPAASPRWPYQTRIRGA